MDIDTIIRRALSHEDVFAQILREFVHTPTTIQQARSSTQIVGNAWEDLCLRYLIEIKRWRAYKLSECPPDELQHLNLRRQDMGIDLIAFDENDSPIAVQCKFRKERRALSWRDISTFDALCMRTGPWNKRIVMTTSHSLRREGATTLDDIFWGRRQFAKLDRFAWMRIGRIPAGRMCGSECALTSDAMRAARLRRFENNRVYDS